MIDWHLEATQRKDTAHAQHLTCGTCTVAASKGAQDMHDPLPNKAEARAQAFLNPVRRAQHVRNPYSMLTNAVSTKHSAAQKLYSYLSLGSCMYLVLDAVAGCAYVAQHKR
eukprot:1159388-Pelagomonas_calceolata.AAC.27